MLYPLSYEGGALFVLVRRYLSGAGERALGRRARRVPDRDRLMVVRDCMRRGVVSSMPHLCAWVSAKRDNARGNLAPPAPSEL
jgi:hypothetical protein